MIHFRTRLFQIFFIIHVFVLSHQGTALSDNLPLLAHVEQHGITWTFSEPVPVGQFINGDYYVAGPVTITMIDPEPAGGRNGAVLNLPANGRAGFDSRQLGATYDAGQRIELPLVMNPGDILVSTISGGAPNTMDMLWRNEKAESCILDAAILTCLSAQVADDAFRPGYCDPEQKIYYAHDIQWNLLPTVPSPANTPDIDFFMELMDGPWLDSVFFGFTAPVTRMPAYGREVARTTSNVSLMLCTDIPQEEKEQLAIKFVQIGIDLYGIIKGGGNGWQGFGGHGSGRKWPIVLSGILLGDENMMHPQQHHPGVVFGEDDQTIYGQGWTGATALFAGHHGLDGEEIRAGWGPYEHLEPTDWISNIGESYRRCCTSISWVGEALSARMLHAESIWNHDAFFDYVDRWMTEDDTESVRQILLQRGWDYSANHLRQGQAWDTFVEDMWAMYREKLPPVQGAEKTLDLLSPTGGEAWTAGTSHDITWQAENVATVVILYSLDNGMHWDTAAENANADDGSFNWTLPAVPSASCLVKIVDLSTPSIHVQSSAAFEILPDATGVSDGKPEAYPLSISCMPNPFNPVTRIVYSIPANGIIRLAVYNLAGQLIAVLVDGFEEEGVHSVTWNGTNSSGKPMSSGMYLLRLDTEQGLTHYKVTMVR